MRVPANQYQPRPRTAQSTSFPAAVGGWVSNYNLAAPPSTPQCACVLDNIFPLDTGGIVRRGSSLYATAEDTSIPIDSVFSYVTGRDERLFMANANKIYDITVVAQAENINLVDDLGNYITDDSGNIIGQNSTENLVAVSGLTSGHWCDLKFNTTGGEYLIIVNGSDPMHLYDGTAWYPITDKSIIRLDYNTQTSEFVNGTTVTGGTSGAQGLIIRHTDSGPVGSLYLQLTSGTFQLGEIVSGGGGSATVSGAPVTLYGAITGVDTKDLSYVLSYKNRLWFIEKGTMNVWYLPVDSITGATTLLPLGGEFSLGGSLLFGHAWSLGYGSSGGLSDQITFFTDHGEVACYQGNDPSDPANWGMVGRYRLGPPLGPKSFIRAGGDLVIATSDGFVALSSIIQTDIAVQSSTAVSQAIQKEWNEEAELRGSNPWCAITWPSRQMTVIALPTANQRPPQMWVINSGTGAWARFTGWSGTCMEVFRDRMFFGSQNGKLIEAYVGGSDLGLPYTATYVPVFTDLGAPLSIKLPKNCRAIFRGPYRVDHQLTIQFDYIVNLPPAPNATKVPGSSRWGSVSWGQGRWGSGSTLKIQREWGVAGGSGAVIAPCLQITSGDTAPLDTEIIDIQVTFSIGDIVT